MNLDDYQIGSKAYNKMQEMESRKFIIKSLSNLGGFMNMVADISPRAQLEIIRKQREEN